MTELVNIISNVGFPIACVIYMGYCGKQTLDKLTSTIDRNTRVIEHLIVKMDAEDVLEDVLEEE